MKGLVLAVGLFLLLSCLIKVSGQNAESGDSTVSKPRFSWSAILDTYYSYDFSKPASHEKAPFLYNHKRHNEASVNLVLIKLSYMDGKTRGNIGLMAGTYPQYNLATEPQLLRFIYEANAGVKLSKSRDLWIDAGVFPSHIGFESAISSDSWTLTRSILAENSPYYEAGVRLSYGSRNEKWYLAGLLLNGWQRISRIDGNNTPAFGTQATYTPSDKLSLNWSSFIGNDQPDSIRKWRYFNNLYAIWNASQNFDVTVGVDYGLEQKEKRTARFNHWYTSVLILRYQKRDWAVAGRVEYYSDKKGVIMPLVNNNAFKMQGYSVNIDRKINSNILWRLEGRVFKNRALYFLTDNNFARWNTSFTTSLCIKFD